MTWADFYLVCFIVGFSFSLLSLLSGGLHLHAHLPHWMDFTHHHVTSHHAHGLDKQTSFFNLPTIMTFLAWFGGVGYVITQVHSFWFVLTFAIAVLAGLIGASAVFLFFTKFLLAHDYTMHPSDYQKVGTLATVSSAISPGRTGEISYSQDGGRKSFNARSDDDSFIAKGTEVVVTGFEKGIAYVHPLEIMLESHDPLI